MASALEIKDLHVAVGGKEILKGVNLTVRQGEIHALMGPNGTGKSTLAYALMGHPHYEVTRGQMRFKGKDLADMQPDERSRLGLFLAFQYPVAIPGVSVANFLRTSLNARRRAANPDDKGIPLPEFRKLLKDKMDLLRVPHEFAGRYLNEGFSGGEKKRAEILQLALLKPSFAILDETDSGLDSDAVRVVADGVNRLVGPHMGVLIITHHERLLEFNRPQYVHILLGGRIVETGGWELAHDVHATGYAKIREKYPEAAAEEDKMTDPKVREPQLEASVR
jgi:Fe-S cluster assembly ATP-binding protein